ncbi:MULTISPECIES: hypothetical protein [unclassified Oceanobacter]|jgi:hypothetical protein|uniref:hypothetical protein n=1 Tax=unclassified Oceanobacter TaxID=2620260 RepID=UPI0026E330D3|nr:MULTISPECIES: hypothetical protein [unclassified Oceanobacter]MDO6681192.1 hypothetical protein [Oceanobacter sp. 5_MG-2023]MDP2504236.1 hypothetical protein [Oceanobacter sp. 3_MG-2023]MDP2546675.1 hypothetical protein [Oceanobacter sp. 4_MG-2023]MDP2608585.1 hypothetical protein [Oceanobacter sp. 1_MG-2023]MDP2611653.1 hypothetical protein [Oceanobacter sp. 2_MG-2023]
MTPKFKIAINSFLFISAAYLNVSTQAQESEAVNQSQAEASFMSEKSEKNAQKKSSSNLTSTDN